MRPRPVSTVIQSDDEVAKEMKKAKKSADEISAEMDRRAKAQQEAQAHYDKTKSAKFVAGLQRQNS